MLLYLDTETTGFSPAKGDRVVELGIVSSDGEVLYHTYFNPEYPVSSGAFAAHGLSNSFLVGYPLFKDKANEIVQVIANATLVIHNAPFDIRFLNNELTLCNLGVVSDYCPQIIDTLSMAKLLGGTKHSLEVLREQYAIKKTEKSHSAVGDALVLREIYLHLVEKVPF